MYMYKNTDAIRVLLQNALDDLGGPKRRYFNKSKE